MAYLALGFAILLILMALGRVFATANPATMARGIRWAAIATAGGAGLYFVLTGRLATLLGFLLPAVILVMRGSTLWRRWAAQQPPSAGQASTVETPRLRMTLDHDTGTMTGTVLAGAFAGARVEELDFEQLLALLSECRREDEEGARLLEAYLDRIAPDWRQRRRAGSETGGGGAMTREEALDILGLKAGASREEIKDAHRRLMQKLHPDHGGSTWIAARVNRAKDVLLEE